MLSAAVLAAAPVTTAFAGPDHNVRTLIHDEALYKDQGQHHVTAGTAASASSEQAGTAPPPSTWAGTLDVAPRNTVRTRSDGDLWPSCWAQDDALYTAWGDGHGFDPSGPFVDLGTARISGGIDDLTGTNGALSDAVAPLWNPGAATRKPTGMLCVGNTIYLAVQDLSTTFSSAPAATIMKSTDGGRTWTGDRSKPMFDNLIFTTIWFADFGRGGEWNTSRYAYAYGLDGNWRNSPPPFNDVPDPMDLFLARVPKAKIQDRKAWEFFAGTKNAAPTWTSKITDKQPVLTDTRRDYPKTFSGADWTASSVLGQGGVSYDAPLHRYLYVGWSEYVQHVYESPNPWGPWSLIADKDYTSFDNRAVQYSGYGTSLPSKFLSADGRTLMLQSNRCCGGTVGYQFGLRPIRLAVHDPGVSNPEPDGRDLATDPTTVPISKSVRQGGLAALTNGDVSDSVDDYDGEVKSDSWWGFTWPQDRKLNQVTFTTGTPAADGGWYVDTPKVQVRIDGQWTDIDGQVYSTPFKPGSAAGDHATYTIHFPTTTGDGVRIIGTPGGDHTYSSMSELAAAANRIDFTTGTPDETPYLFDADGSQSNGVANRFADGTAHFTYRFGFPSGTTSAQVTLTIDNEYSVEVSPDNQNWTSVLKVDQPITNGSNRADRRIDVTPYLGSGSGGDRPVYVRISDAYPADGFGGRVYHVLAGYTG
ncbi:MAG: DUF4185 domain-containing protein [Microlunatus sp.]|nr:DUF4185 domain-containing protein [Microlunatus sp.]